MANSESRSLTHLRRLLGLSGALAMIIGVVNSAHLATGLGLISLIAGALPGLAAVVRITCATGLALGAMYACYVGHTATPFPAVDWVRPRGMDVWPGLLQAGGIVLLLVCAPAVMRASGGRLLRTIGGIGAILVVAYWFFPQHFVIDELRPAEAGKASMPVVMDGKVVSMSWGRMGVPATPIEALPDLVDNEARLAAIAHGMGHQAGESSGGGVLRATLWAIQGVASPAVIWSSALSMGVAALVAFGLLRRVPLNLGLRRTSIGVLLAVFVVPSGLNLVLRLSGMIGGLPEAQADVSAGLMQSAGALSCGLIAWMAGLAAADEEQS